MSPRDKGPPVSVAINNNRKCKNKSICTVTHDNKNDLERKPDHWHKIKPVLCQTRSLLTLWTTLVHSVFLQNDNHSRHRPPFCGRCWSVASYCWSKSRDYSYNLILFDGGMSCCLSHFFEEEASTQSTK